MEQNGTKKVFFTGMDKTGKGVCELFAKGKCPLGELCPLRHLTGNKLVVCKHWLRGLCKKCDECDFLHEYDLSRMPECFFFSKYGVCNNTECPFRHTDPESKIRDCPWYDRGFCRHGPNCKQRHIRRTICPNYLCGLCLDGEDCKFSHPLFSLPVPQEKPFDIRNNVQCYNCYERTHKVSNCPYLPSGLNPSTPAEFNRSRNYNAWNSNTERKDVSEVTCYKCGKIGHYANRCNNAALVSPLNVKIEPGNPAYAYAQFLQATYAQMPQVNYAQQNSGQKRKDISEVTCFKCGEVGHYANRCNNGAKVFRPNSPSSLY